MNDVNANDLSAILRVILVCSESEHIRITQHAFEEMAEEDIKLNDVLEAFSTGQILENYPEHRRGACCLIGGKTKKGRHLHIVCTTMIKPVIIITAYEPKLPKWITPVKRRKVK